jgi:hypothetical protein
VFETYQNAQTADLFPTDCVKKSLAAGHSAIYQTSPKKKKDQKEFFAAKRSFAADCQKALRRSLRPQAQIKSNHFFGGMYVEKVLCGPNSARSFLFKKVAKPLF